MYLKGLRLFPRMCHRVGSYHWYYPAWPGKISVRNRRQIWHEEYPVLPHPLACSAGRKIYMDEYWNGDEHLCNLCQQIAGSFNYAAQLRPELMFSVSQLARVISRPTKEILSLAQQVIENMIGSLDLKCHLSPWWPQWSTWYIDGCAHTARTLNWCAFLAFCGTCWFHTCEIHHSCHRIG